MGERVPPAEGRTVLLPSEGWRHTGEILGRAASFLDTSDNSVVVLCAEETDRAEVVCPPAGSVFVFPDESGRDSLKFRVDDDLIKNVALWAGGKTSFSVDTFEEATAPFHCVPIISEVARLRRRGTPLLTPIILSEGMWSVESIVQLGVYLAQLQVDSGLSLVFVSDHCSHPTTETHSLAVALESLVPQFLDGQAEGMEAPMLFQVVCGAAGSAVRSIGSCKSVAGDQMLSHWAYGATRDTRAHAVVPWTLRHKVWDCVAKRQGIGMIGVEAMAILSITEPAGGFRASQTGPRDLVYNLACLGEIATEEFGKGSAEAVAKVSIPHAFRELDTRRDVTSRVVPGDDGLMFKKDGNITLLAPDDSVGLDANGMVEAVHELAGERHGTGKVWSFKTQDLVAPWRRMLEGK